MNGWISSQHLVYAPVRVPTRNSHSRHSSVPIVVIARRKQNKWIHFCDLEFGCMVTWAVLSLLRSSTCS